jgi:protease II
MKNTNSHSESWLSSSIKNAVLILSVSGCASMSHPTATTYEGHGASSVDAKQIAPYLPKPLDPALAAKIRNLLEVQAPGMGMMIPGGTPPEMYFGWSVSGVAQVWKVDRPLGFPEQVTSGEDPTALVDVTPNGKFMVLSRDHAGEENPGLYLLPEAGGPLVKIFHKPQVRAHFAWVTNDSDSIYFFANDIKPDSNALYKYKISTGKTELIFSEPGLWFLADTFGDERFLLGRMKGALASEYYDYGLVSKTLAPVLGQNELQEYDVSYGRTPGEYLVLTSKFGEFRRLYAMLKSKFAPITGDVKMDLASFQIDHSRMHIYLNWNNQGYTKLEVLDPFTYKTLAFPSFEKADNVYAGVVSRYGRYVSVGTETVTSPRVSYVYDWKDRKLVQWVRPSTPEVDTSTFVRATLEKYPAHDGTEIPMLVTRPKKCASDPCPVIVNFHGGPEGQSVPGFNRTAQIFAAAGFVFVEPNVRGSDGYGKTWLHSDDGPKRLDVISDIEDCSKLIKSKWAKNGRIPKIGVMGGSYGGYSTLMAMSRFAGSYDAGVAIVGMANLRTFLLNTAPYRRILRISEYGDPEKDKDALEKLSPTTYLNQVKAPLMLIQGVSDPRVPVGEALQMHDQLSAKGIPSELMIFPDEGHGAAKRDNKVLELGHALRFMQEHLQNR